MTSVTRHAARACLTQNDMQGMAVLYPCGTPYQDEAFNTESLCVKSKRNTGLLRLAQVMLLPLAIVSVAIVLLIECGTYRKKQKVKKLNKAESKKAKPHKSLQKHKALHRANFTGGDALVPTMKGMKGKASVLLGQTPNIKNKHLKASSAHFEGMDRFEASISKAPGQKLGVTLHVVPEGVCVSKCTEGGVMSSAGLIKGDIIAMANGDFLETSENFSRIVLNNQSVTMSVIRPAYITATFRGGKMGMKVKRVGNTLIVSSLTRGGAGETAGLKEMDTLLTVDGIDLRTTQAASEDEDPQRVLQQVYKDKKGAVKVEVRRMNTGASPIKSEEEDMVQRITIQEG